jgi:hypothetical protein
MQAMRARGMAFFGSVAAKFGLRFRMAGSLRLRQNFGDRNQA